MVDFTNPEGTRPSNPNLTPTEAEPASSVTTITTGPTHRDGQEPRAGVSRTSGDDFCTRYEPSTYELAGGFLSLMIWTLVFAVGIIFPSEPFRNALTDKGSAITSWLVLPYLCGFLLTYTVSNVALLCCISAWLGELGRRTRIDGATPVGQFQRGDYIAAIMRGFLAYLAILTGYVVVGSGVNVFVSPSPEGFVRLAAIVSLLGFLSGFNPALFRSLTSTISGRVITQRSPDGTAMQIVEGPAQIQQVVRPDATATPSPSRINQLTS